MTQLSPHFELREFLASETAARMGKEITPTTEQAANLARLCISLLEPIRMKLGRPLVITSGLRPAWLNEAIGGSKTSAHMNGLAADIKVVGMTPAVFCRWIQMNAEAEDWKFDQCILEFDQWTHLSVADKPRMQYLTARSDAGHVSYQNGILD